MYRTKLNADRIILLYLWFHSVNIFVYEKDGHTVLLTLVLLNRLLVIFIHLKLELLTQFPASNE